LRGDGTVDLSKVAALNGGGGHSTAAGCNQAKVLGRELLDLVMDKMKWE